MFMTRTLASGFEHCAVAGLWSGVGLGTGLVLGLGLRLGLRTWLVLGLGLEVAPIYERDREQGEYCHYNVHGQPEEHGGFSLGVKRPASG